MRYQVSSIIVYCGFLHFVQNNTVLRHENNLMFCYVILKGIETATSGALLREEMLISMVIMDISTTENMQAAVDHITIGIDDIMDQKLPLRQVGQVNTVENVLTIG